MEHTESVNATSEARESKRGRKPVRQQSAADRLTARVPPDDKAAWEAQAAREGKSLSAWVIDCLNSELRRAQAAQG